MGFRVWVGSGGLNLSMRWERWVVMAIAGGLCTLPPDRELENAESGDSCRL